MKWFFRILGLLAGLILTMLLVGGKLPEKHLAQSTQVFGSSLEDVWSVLTDMKNWPTWRSELNQISLEGNTFTEVSDKGDSVKYQIEELVPPNQMVTRIITPDLPYGGSWTYQLTPSEGGCKLVLTENGEIYNPIFRFMSGYFFVIQVPWIGT